MQSLRNRSLILSGPYGYSDREDDVEEREDIITLFYQGHGASRAQAASYAGAKGVSVLKDGEELYHASCRGAPLLLYNIHPTEELLEVRYERSFKLLHLAERFATTARSLLVNVEGALPYFLDLSQVSLAGDIDVAQFVTHYEKMVRETPGKYHVVFGCSRGAATVLIGVASLQRRLQKSVALVIAEAPFDSVPSVLGESTIFPELQQRGLGALTAYRRDQESPLQAMERFPLDTPVAFVTSRADRRVPRRCTQRLVNRLRARGHPMLHHLTLQQSHHSVMSLHNDEDVARYLRFVGMLYERYCPRRVAPDISNATEEAPEKHQRTT